jgi:hypothetical protein
MALDFLLETRSTVAKSKITAGTPADLKIDFLGSGVKFADPSDFSKWSLQLIVSNIHIHGIEYDIQYDTAGMLVNGCEFLVPEEWHQYLPVFNIPDAGDTIISLPSAGLVMTSDTQFISGVSYVLKKGSEYWVRLVAGSMVSAKRFKGGVRWLSETNYVTA